MYFGKVMKSSGKVFSDNTSEALEALFAASKHACNQSALINFYNDRFDPISNAPSMRSE
jgi:hypothetical protein